MASARAFDRNQARVNTYDINPALQIQYSEVIMIDDPMLAQKSLFRVDEVADYFGVSPSTVRLWIDHGHLEKEKIVGSIRVSRESILVCRFRKIENPAD